MKKLFLVSVFLLSCSSAYSQAFVEGATKFTLDFSELCTRGKEQYHPAHHSTGYEFLGGNISSEVFPLIDEQGLLKIKTAEPPVPHPSPAFFDLMHRDDSDSCVALRDTYSNGGRKTIDLSYINSRVVVYAKASAPTSVQFHLGSSIAGWPSNTFADDRVPAQFMELTTEIKAFELDFTSWEFIDRVNMFGLFINRTDVDVYIEKIIFGQEVTPNPSANTISGKVYDDPNNSCSFQNGEKPLSNILLSATANGKVFYGLSDGEGKYRISIDSGTAVYTVRQLFNGRRQTFITTSCHEFLTVNTSGDSTEFPENNFADNLNECAQLNVEISSDRRRRCFTSNTFVRYVNLGSTASAASVVKVIYPEFVEPLSSVPAWTAKVGDTLIYELGSLGVDQEGRIHVIDSVICGREDIRNLTQCTQAIISPGLQCTPIHTSWDGSSIAVKGTCASGIARFQLANRGENMEGTSEYRIYSNDTLIYTSTFQLQKNNAFEIEYPANGATIRLEADQHPYHPGSSIPRAFVEACSEGPIIQQPNARNFVLTVRQDDRDEEIAIDCMPILDSYDPNDKRALPVGFTEDHLIKAGEEIQYTIRFQNTGSDLAYTVKVVDTLDTNLDMTSFVEGGASHPYTLSIRTEGGKSILTYTFNNINLKDSTTSEPESHGALSFYIKSRADLPDGVHLQNKADIFFDYNSAIVTNTVEHIIGTYTPTDFSKGNSVQVVTGLFDQQQPGSLNAASLYPNPATDHVTIELKHGDNATLEITDLSGKLQWDGALEGKTSTVSLSYLESGMYLYKIHRNGEWIGAGKLLIK